MEPASDIPDLAMDQKADAVLEASARNRRPRRLVMKKSEVNGPPPTSRSPSRNGTLAVMMHSIG